MINFFKTLFDKLDVCCMLLEQIHALLERPYKDNAPENIVQSKLALTEHRPTTAAADPLLSIRAACLELNIARSTLFRLRQEGVIDEVRLGRHVRFRQSDIDRLRDWYSIPKGKL